MSGGSYDYLCYKMEDAAEAMHDIEWVDSGDYGSGDDEKAIKLALGDNVDALTLEEMLISAKEIKEQLIKYGA